MGSVSTIIEGRPMPTMPSPPTGKVSVLRYLWAASRDSGVAMWPEDAYRDDFLEVQMFKRHMFVLNAPEYVKHVLLDNADNYHKGSIARVLLEPGLGVSLFTSEDETWKRQHRTLQPIFQHRRIMTFVPTMTEMSAAILQRWEETEPGAPINMSAEMSRLALKVISRIMFSTEDERDIDEISEAITTYQQSVRPSFADLLGLPSWVPRSRSDEGAKAIQIIDRVANKLIADREQSGIERPDLLSMLLGARDTETGERMNLREIRDHVATVLTAGHESASTILSWIWYLLDQHPEEERLLHEEVDSVLGGRAPEVEDLEKLPRVRMIVDEALRLYPTAHTMSRTALEDDEIHGLRIPKGATIIMSPWLIQRNQKRWERANHFMPGRFENEPPSSRPRYVYMPFGAGPRICIGARLAITELVIGVAMIAQKYKPRLVPRQSIEAVGLVTLRPKNPIMMTLERR